MIKANSVKVIKQLIRLAIAGGLLIYLLAEDRLNFAKLGLFSKYPLFITLFIILLAFNNILLNSLRLKQLLGRSDFNLRPIIPLTMIGNMFNSIIPGAVSGDLIKGYQLYRLNIVKQLKFVPWILVLDRISGLNALILLAFFGILFQPFNPQLQNIDFFIIIATFGVIAFYILIFTLPRLKIKKYKYLNWLLVLLDFERQAGFKRHIYSLLISLLIFISIALFMLQSAEILSSGQLAIQDHFKIIAIGFLIIAIPIAPAGIGVGHLAFDYLYSMFGISGGADIFNLFVILQTAVNLSGFWPFLRQKQTSR